MLRKNWTMRKTKNASVASSFGTMSGRKVFTQSIWAKMMYCGTMSTWIGSMIVTSMIAKVIAPPRNVSLANA